MARAARRPRSVLAAAILVEHQEVRLDRLVAALARLAGGSLEVVDGAHGRGVDHLAVKIFGTACPDHPTARPVDRDALADCPAEQLIDWHAQRLALDGEAGVENSAGGIRIEARRYGAGERIEGGVEAADRAWVFPNQQLAHAVDRGSDAGATMFPELRPAGHALIGADLEKRVDLPPAIDMKLVKLGYLHFPAPISSPPWSHFSSQIAATWKG